MPYIYSTSNEFRQLTKMPTKPLTSCKCARIYYVCCVGLGEIKVLMMESRAMHHLSTKSWLKISFCQYSVFAEVHGIKKNNNTLCIYMYMYLQFLYIHYMYAKGFAPSRNYLTREKYASIIPCLHTCRGGQRGRV
jgi:hypothetical protein